MTIYGDLKYSADFCEELFDLWWCKFSSLSLSSFALESTRYVHELSSLFIWWSLLSHKDTQTIYAIVDEITYTENETNTLKKNYNSALHTSRAISKHLPINQKKKKTLNVDAMDLLKKMETLKSAIL